MRALCLFTAVVAGCGGSETPVETVEEDTTVEAVPDEDPVVEEAPDQPDEPAGPGRATIRVTVGGEASELPFEVLDQSEQSVAAGRSGETISVPAGSYYVRVAVEDEDVILNTPTHEEEIAVAPGSEPTEITVNVPVAHIVLRVSHRGRPLRNPNVTLYAEGSEEPVARFRAGNDAIQISPGRYEAEVQSGGGNYRIRGLTFMDGARQEIPVNVE
jgi:hypothetical protein